MISVEEIVQALLRVDAMARDCSARASQCGSMQCSGADISAFEGGASGVQSSVSAAQGSLLHAAASLNALRSDIQQAILQITQ